MLRSALKVKGRLLIPQFAATGTFLICTNAKLRTENTQLSPNLNTNGVTTQYEGSIRNSNSNPHDHKAKNVSNNNYFALSASSSSSRSSLEQILQSIYERLSLTIPIVEASIRGFRLVQTTCLMVMDYELANYHRSIQSIISKMNQDQIQIHELEIEIQTLTQQLERAQLEYTSTGDETSTKGQSNKTQDAKRNAVYEAARSLSQAQQKLSSLQSSSTPSTATHTKAANRLLTLCRSNGGVYIKIGQHLANLDYLLPPEYIDALSSLYNEAPVTDYLDVCRVIWEEWGVNPEEWFDGGFDKKPIASASLAQVHVGYRMEDELDANGERTKRRKKYAIKVQHRGLRETSNGDLLALAFVVGCVEWCFGERFQYGWILEEIAPNLPKELDFRHEGGNAEKAALHIKKTGINCIIPKVHWDQTTSRVLCMDFEEGFRSTDVQQLEEAGLNKKHVAKLISSVFNAQVFQTGFVHCDPHPANVLLREKDGKPQIVLVDHGLYKQIDNDFRLTYAKLWKALMMADVKEIKVHCGQLGIHEMYPLLAAMLTSRPFDEILERSKTKSFSPVKKSHINNDDSVEAAADKAMIRGYAQQYLQEIIQMLDKVPRQMLLLFKMNDCLRHIEHTLGAPTNSSLIVAGKYAAETVFREEEKRLRDRSRSNNAESYYNGNRNRSIVMLARLKSWISYITVLSRIHIHDLTLWWIDRCGKNILHLEKK